MARGGLVPLLLFVVASAGPVPAPAVQGGGVDNVTTFWSPMELEVPAEPIRAMRGGMSWRVEELAGRYCEGLTIPEIVVETSGDPEMRLKVHYDAYVELAGGRSRKATLLLELLVDGQAVGAAEKTKFHVSPGKRKRVGMKMELSPVDSTVFRMGTEPKLRIMLEGPNEDRLRRWAKELAAAAIKDTKG